MAPEGREEETVIRLARVGYDNTIGYLKGGISSWTKELDQVKSIPATEFTERYKNSNLNVLDVRKNGEFESEHLLKVESKPLDYINEWTNYLDKSKEYHIHCAGGYRSMIACSILKSRGFENIIDVAGGFAAIAKTGVETTNFVCPSTKK